ncbi:birc7-a [Symbiodinium sp. KB8]|nr:birc7-a [Symbiodinium sp. KB8]
MFDSVVAYKAANGQQVQARMRILHVGDASKRAWSGRLRASRLRLFSLHDSLARKSLPLHRRWKWDMQDGAMHAIGWVKEEADPESGWATVLWQTGFENTYRFSRSRQDIVPVRLDPSCSAARALPAEVQASLSGAIAAPGLTTVNYTLPDSGVSVELVYRRLAQPAPGSVLPKGTMVVRGPTWTWMDQDGKDGYPGWVVADASTDEWVDVCWHATQHSDGYRMKSPHQDLTPIEPISGSALLRLKRDSGGVARVQKALDAASSAAAVSAAAAAAAPAAAPAVADRHTLIDGVPAEEAIMILKVEKASLQDEITHTVAVCDATKAERDSAMRECARLTARATELEEALRLLEEPKPQPKPALTLSDRLGECIICYDQPASVAVVPCGHLCFCTDCIGHSAPDSCPVCREGVTGNIRVFIAGV